jgi:hypothetical protein
MRAEIVEKPRLHLFCVVWYPERRFGTRKTAMNVLLDLPKETAEKVARAAASAGKDMPSFLQDFVKQSFTGEAKPRRTVAEILAPFHAEVEQSGIDDKQLDSVFDSARQNAFANRHRNGR